MSLSLDHRQDTYPQYYFNIWYGKFNAWLYFKKDSKNYDYQKQKQKKNEENIIMHFALVSTTSF